MEELFDLSSIDTSIKKIDHSQFKLACIDLLESIQKYKLWIYLGWNDIKMRYRGSILGPFWITASMLIFIIAFSIVYSRLFHQTLNEYVPFLTTGYLIWLLISTTLTDSCNTFIDSAFLITDIKLPYIMYVFRISWRNTIIFLHNSLVFLAVAFYYQVAINWNIVFVLPGLFLVLFNLVAIGILLAIVGAKYRDIAQVTISLIQVAFFVTPITWNASALSNSLIIKLNPLNYFIDIVRMPLLGQCPSLSTWIICLVLSLVVFCCSFLLFSRYRRYIPFWI